jgi:DNA-binding response OmpR family regulator
VTVKVVALENDLFFSVKIRDTLRHHEIDAQIARTLTAFEQRLEQDKPALAIVDIAIQRVDWEAAIRAARAQNVPVLAFGSHMDLEARAKALQAGALKVIANSKFAKDMPDLVQRMMKAPETVVSEGEEEGH